MPHTAILTPTYDAGITKLITATLIRGIAKASYTVTPLFGAAPTSTVFKFVYYNLKHEVGNYNSACCDNYCRNMEFL